MDILRIVLVLLLGALGFEQAERALIARSMSTLQPPWRPNPMRVATIIPPPLPPPPPPPSPYEVPGAT